MMPAETRPSNTSASPLNDTWLSRLVQTPGVRELVGYVEQGGPAAARGIVGSSATLLTASLARQTNRLHILVVGHLDDADEARDELEQLGLAAEKFPALEYAPGESAVGLDLLAARLTIVQRLRENEAGRAGRDLPQILIAPIQALMQSVPDPGRSRELLRLVRPGDALDPGELAGWLDAAGYQRVEAIESAGEFSIRGGIIDIFPPGSEPARIDLFGDEVEALYEIDLDTMGSDRRLDRLELIGGTAEQLQRDDGMIAVADVLPASSVIIFTEMLELTEQARGYYERLRNPAGILSPSEVFRTLARRGHATVEVNHLSNASVDDRCVALPVRPLPPFSDDTNQAVGELAALAQSHETWITCQNEGERTRLEELLAEAGAAGRAKIVECYLHRGFIWEMADDARPLALVPYHELMHRFHTRRRVRRVAAGRTMDAFLDLQPGDFVVHRDHGIAQFIGLRTLEEKRGAGATEEFLTLEFKGGSKLHVPVTKIDLVQKYVGSFAGKPELSTLGGKKWKRQKEQVRDAVRDYAAEMLRLQAAREAMPGIRYPADTKWQHAFEAEFPYEETEDQLASIQAIKRDMSDPRPMDRLVCGDVGFGKTEVAMRAAFKAVEFGKQVAVLVPTTVLAEQHERTFRDRFADYPFRIESISRFKTKREQNALMKALQRGGVDLIIGTHRLLSKDVKFADLGLVIIDEEQRFGVEHKQKLLQFRTTADVLTLSATPIPRTLHMSLLGLRDISSLTTPPLDRRAVVTEVMAYDSRRIQQAIERELAREGQVFFVHNRVYNIESVADDVRKLAPDARIIIGHGQMPMRQLERVMLQFVRGEADILVCTTIIESGIDLPRVNTMIINDADRFGLSELHQLRGRVGRYKHRAYCYLMTSPDKVMSEVALKRLRAIEGYAMLGAGFKIALRDLEIRGAGSLLGHEQSGHISAVGYEMYCQLLEQEVAHLKNQKIDKSIDVTVDLGITGSLPKGYVPSDARRMDAYRRISIANDRDALARVEHDLTSAYGQLPGAAVRLIELAEIRIGANALSIVSITRHERDIIFRTKRPDLLEEHLGPARGTLRKVGQPDARGTIEIYYRPPQKYLEEADSLLKVLKARLGSQEKGVKVTK